MGARIVEGGGLGDVGDAPFVDLSARDRVPQAHREVRGRGHGHSGVVVQVGVPHGAVMARKGPDPVPSLPVAEHGQLVCAGARSGGRGRKRGGSEQRVLAH